MRAAAVWINRVLWTFIATVVVIAGALAALGRHYVDYVDDYQAEIVAAIRDRTGLSLQAGTLSGRWVSASAQFTIGGLKLFNPARPDEVVLAVDRLVVRIGLWQSLANLTPVISTVDGRGAVAQLDEVRAGVWQLRGFPGGGPVDPLVDALLRVQRADIAASRAHLHFLGGPRATLDAQSVQLQRARNFRRLQLRLQVAEDGAPLKLTLEARGDPRQRDRFSARGYAQFAKVNLTPILPLARHYGFDLTHGRIDGAAWLEWRDGDFSVRGNLALPALDLAGLTGRAVPPITQVSSPFLLAIRNGSQQLWLPRVRARWGSEAIAVDSLLIRRGRDDAVFTIALPRLRLEDVQRLAGVARPLAEPFVQLIEDLAPRGELRNLQLQLPRAPAYRDQLRVRTEIAGLAVAPWHGAPGLRGINGYLDSGLASGSAVLEGIDAQLDFPHVYHQPVPFDRLRGALEWWREGDRIRVQSGPISASSAAGVASILLTLDLNTRPGDAVPPQMTLIVGMRNSAAQFRKFFIPYTLPPKLLAWLDRSITAARLPRGAFIYNGSLRAGDHDHRSVQLFLDVEEGALSYHEEWPALHDLSAGVWLDDAELDVHGRRARVFEGIDLGDIEVALRRREEGQWLDVTGAVHARDDDLLRLIRESPVQKNLSGALDHWQWRGEAQAQVALGIPIGAGGEHAPPPSIHVDADLGDGAGGTLRLTDLNLTLTDVRGPLRYHTPALDGGQPGLFSEGLDARLYGRPARIAIRSDEQHHTDIHATGRVAIGDVRDWLQQPLLDRAQGETGFALDVQLRGDASALQVTSDLTGVALDLPAPYRKSPEQALPLTVAMPLRGERQLTIAAGDWADLRLFWRTEHEAALAPGSESVERRVLRAGVLRLGGSGEAAPESGSLLITGSMPAAELAPWRELFGGHRAQSAALPATVAADTPPPPNVPPPTVLAVALRDLHLPAVSAAGMTLRDVTVSGRHYATDAPGWRFQVNADRLAGSIAIPDAAAAPLQIDLTALRLPAPVAAAPGSPPQPSALVQVDPAGAIAADVQIRELWRGDENWGDLGFALRPVTQGVRLDGLRGTLRGIALQPLGATPAALTWQRREDGHRTRFVGRLAIGDIADVLARWQFERTITSRSGFVEADIGWLGAPDEIGLNKLDGVATLNLDDGQFLKAPGSASGALKVVGVFNFANLLRRLQLDFSDLFKDGVSFDSIDGELAMNNGVFSARRPIEIIAPSSRFRLDGRIDFVSDQADMELVATLPVASNLPWMAALAGGLPAAAGVYVASKLFESQVDQFSSAVYEIRGPWRDPDVRFRRMFDDQLPRASKPSAAGHVSETKP